MHPVNQFHFVAKLVRCVALVPLMEGGLPDYLFASGRANRYNPAGVFCVYFSEDERTARAEYARRLGQVARQPLATYFAEVNLAKALDLADEETLSALGPRPLVDPLFHFGKKFLELVCSWAVPLMRREYSISTLRFQIGRLATPLRDPLALLVRPQVSDSSMDRPHKLV